jgi:site-specific recombinase XerD
MARTIDVSPIRGKRQPKGRVVKVDEIATLFETCAKDSNRALGNRDIAILAMLYGAGLRRAEVAELQVENVNIAEGRCKVIGKGNKERTVFLPPGTVNAVVEWLVNRGVKPGYLFNRVRKSGFVVVGRAINAQTVYDIVRLRHKKAGIKPFSPHDLRRSFISELLDAGVDLSTIARQVGHSNVQITARYDRRDEATQQRGVLQLNVPYGTMKGNDGVKTETDAE